MNFHLFIIIFHCSIAQWWISRNMYPPQSCETLALREFGSSEKGTKREIDITIYLKFENLTKTQLRSEKGTEREIYNLLLLTPHFSWLFL